MSTLKNIKQLLETKEYKNALLYLENNFEQLKPKELGDVLIDTLKSKANDYQYQMIKLAFSKGAEVTFQPGQTAVGFLSNAISKKNLNLVKFIIEIFNIDIHCTQLRKSPAITTSEFIISSSAATGSPEILNYFISQGLNLYHNDNHPFAWSCSHGNLENAQFLLKNFDIDINAYNRISSSNILSWSMRDTNMPIVSFLLDNNINILDSDLEVLLHEDDKMLALFVDKLNSKQIKTLYNFSFAKKDSPQNTPENTKLFPFIESLYLKEQLSSKLTEKLNPIKRTKI